MWFCKISVCDIFWIPLSYQLQCPERLQFLYEVQMNHDHESMERLGILLKIATALASDMGDTSELEVHVYMCAHLYVHVCVHVHVHCTCMYMCTYNFYMYVYSTCTVVEGILHIHVHVHLYIYMYQHTLYVYSTCTCTCMYEDNHKAALIHVHVY